MSKRRGSLFLFILVLVILLIAVFLGQDIILGFLKKSNIDMGKKIVELKEEIIPLKIKITSIENDVIYYTMRFYDTEDTLVKTVEDSITGQYLFIDFIIIKGKDGYLFFPNIVYSDIIPSAIGKDLIHLYNEGGFPLIYLKSKMDKNYIDYIKKGFAYSLDADLQKDGVHGFGNSLHLIGGIQKIHLNYYYFYTCHTKKGGVEVILK